MPNGKHPPPPRGPVLKPGAPAVPQAVVKPAAVSAQPVALPPTLKLELKGKNQKEFKEQDLTKTFLVHKGSKIEFKVTGAKPTDTVSWSNGMSGIGTTPQEYSFDTLSRDSNDRKTVTATVRGGKVEFKAFVYELVPVLTPVDNFRGRSLTDFGVDERVNLTYNVKPAIPAAVNDAKLLGGLKWSTIGAGTRTSGGLLSAQIGDGKATYTAPYSTDSSSILKPTRSSTSVRLTLTVQDGFSTGCAVFKDITIHLPKAHMKKDAARGDIKKSLVPCAGFYGNIFLDPKNVSFMTLHWQEAGGLATFTGLWVGDKAVHEPTTKTAGTDMPITGGNLATGCQVTQIDTVHTKCGAGAFNITRPDAATTPDATTMHWPIFWQYRPADLSKEWIRFMIFHHKAEVYQNGKMTVTKKCADACTECDGKSVVTLNAGPSNWDAPTDNPAK